MLRVENRNLRENLGGGLRLLFGLAALLPDRGAAFPRKLRPEEVANPGKDRVLPMVEPFQPRQLVRRLRRLPAKLVRVAQLGEKFHRIVHPVHAKLQRVDILRPDIDGDFLPRRVRAARVQRKVAGLFLLSEGV